VQVARGTAEAARRGLAERVRFAVQSYDDALPGPFDLAIAIESLIHSVDPAASIANIAAALAPGGHLVVVDDMPEPGGRDEADLALFRRMWRCPVAPEVGAWRAAMAAAGLEIVAERDLTALQLLRPPDELAAPLARQKRRAFWLGLVGGGLREQADIGGMTLELLHGRGAMRYRLMVGRRPG
jgi:SAM-dependent methyltransferase